MLTLSQLNETSTVVHEFPRLLWSTRYSPELLLYSSPPTLTTGLFASQARSSKGLNHVIADQQHGFSFTKQAII